MRAAGRRVTMKRAALPAGGRRWCHRHRLTALYSSRTETPAFRSRPGTPRGPTRSEERVPTSSVARSAPVPPQTPPVGLRRAYHRADRLLRARDGTRTGRGAGGEVGVAGTALMG